MCIGKSEGMLIKSLNSCKITKFILMNLPSFSVFVLEEYSNISSVMPVSFWFEHLRFV